MKNKIIIVIIIILCLIVVALIHFWILPSRYEKESKERNYSELDEKVEENINNWNSNNNNNDLLSWDKEKVTIKVKELLEDNKSAIIEIDDKNNNPISWGIDFSIQKMSEGNNEWYDLKSKAKIEWLKTIVSPDDNGITEMKIDWSNMYGELDNGTYRIVKRNGFTNIYSESFNI